MGTLDTALGLEHGHWRQLVTPGWDKEHWCTGGRI